MPLSVNICVEVFSSSKISNSSLELFDATSGRWAATLDKFLGQGGRFRVTLVVAISASESDLDFTSHTSSL